MMLFFFFSLSKHALHSTGVQGITSVWTAVFLQNLPSIFLAVNVWLQNAFLNTFTKSWAYLRMSFMRNSVQISFFQYFKGFFRFQIPTFFSSCWVCNTIQLFETSAKSSHDNSVRSSVLRMFLEMLKVHQLPSAFMFSVNLCLVPNRPLHCNPSLQIRLP